MPGAHLPLHIFEPRYRALVRWCLDEALPIGVATIAPGSGTEPPELLPMVGVGRIVAHQGLPDGRSNIVLHSVGRMRILAEVDAGTPFRVARGVLALDDDRGSDEPIARLRQILGQLAGRAGSGAEAMRVLALPPWELVNLVARKVIEDADARARYLGADRLADRAECVIEHLVPLVGSGEPVEVE
jgi:Lon protease-like protein